MTLLVLIVLLVAPYGVLSLADRRPTGERLTAAARAKVGLSLLLAFTASGHFLKTEEMAAMLPPSVPFREAIVTVTGVLELLGAVGIWIHGLERTTAIYLILMLLGFLPVNIYAALNHISFGGHGAGPAYLWIRVPFQFLLIVWTWWAGELGAARWKEPHVGAGRALSA